MADNIEPQREIWRSINNFPNYEISNIGRVRNVHGRILKPSISHKGYYYVGLCKQGKQKKNVIHRLVATEFIDNINNHNIIDHIDRNKLNNCVHNLRWCTVVENNRNKSICKKNICGMAGVTSTNKKIVGLHRLMIKKENKKENHFVSINILMH